jgi:hypothetical protein
MEEKMRRLILATLPALVLAASIALAHDPRTVAKDFTHGLKIEGAGTLNLTYKSLHFNESVYKRMQADDTFRQRMNAGVWADIGSVDAGFDVVLGQEKVAKGRYTLGLGFGPSDAFALVLKGTDKATTVPLKSTSDNPDVAYLTFALYPTDKPDTFVLEGRCGKYRATTDVTVPYLGEHAHPGASK